MWLPVTVNFIQEKNFSQTIKWSPFRMFPHSGGEASDSPSLSFIQKFRNPTSKQLLQPHEEESLHSLCPFISLHRSFVSFVGTLRVRVWGKVNIHTLWICRDMTRHCSVSGRVVVVCHKLGLKMSLVPAGEQFVQNTMAAMTDYWLVLMRGLLKSRSQQMIMIVISFNVETKSFSNCIFLPWWTFLLVIHRDIQMVVLISVSLSVVFPFPLICPQRNRDGILTAGEADCF